MHHEIEKRLRSQLGECEIAISSQAGDSGEHFLLEVEAEVFRDKSRLEQHRLILKALADLIASNQIHALEIKTKIPQ